MEEAKSIKDMSIKDDLYLSPFEKYTLYGIFPWSFLINILLIILTTSEIVLYISVNTNYSYQQLLLWNKVFLNRDVQGSDALMINSFHIYHYSKLKTYIQETVERYYDINSNTLDNYDYHYDDDGAKKPVKLYINYVDANKASDKGYKTEYKLTPEYIGPFSDDKNRDFIDLIDTFNLEFTLIHDVNSKFPTSLDCFTWKISQKFKYTLHGIIKVSLSTQRESCGNIDGNQYTDFGLRPYFFLHLSVFLVSFTSLYMFAKSSYDRLQVVGSVNARATFSLAWNSLLLSEKLSFIRIWSIIDLTGNIFQILGAISCSLSKSIPLDIQERTVGFGCFFAWVGLVQYLKPYQNSYIVGNTLKRSYQTIIPYTIGILPIFLAFAFFAMSLLWETGNYNSLAYSMLLQFAMINGDSLIQSVVAAVSANNLFGIIYSFGFLLFFICVIHNIFIAIISESYESLKVKPVKPYYEEEDDDGSIPSQSSSQISPNKFKGSETGIFKKKRSKNLLKLLDAKVKDGDLQNEKTLKEVKKVNKLMKKIRKYIQKIENVMVSKKKVNVDNEKILETGEDILLNRLDQYIEVLFKRAP